MTYTAEQRRTYAITKNMQRRREELRPVLVEIADRIDTMGWRRARPLIRAALARRVQRAGLWRLNKRDTYKVLEALREGPRGQLCLFDWKDPQ